MQERELKHRFDTAPVSALGAWQLPDRYATVEGSLARGFVVANLHHLIHWPTHGGYNFVSGPLADITLITAFAGTLYLWLRKHNCHVHRCWRLQWHPHPDHGHPVCKKHHGLRAWTNRVSRILVRRRCRFGVLEVIRLPACARAA